MMNCKSVQQSLSAYIDQELPGSEMLRIRAHVTRCAVCTQEEDDLRALKRMLSSVPEVEPPSGFETRLLDCIKAEELSRERSSTFGLPVLLCVSVAAACLTLIALPSPQRTVANKVPAPRFEKNDAAFGIQVDQASFSGSDPLRGGGVILATDYERR